MSTLDSKTQRDNLGVYIVIELIILALALSMNAFAVVGGVVLILIGFKVLLV